MTIIKYVVIFIIAAVGIYFLLQHFILETSPWKEFDGLECDANNNCTSYECRQQNNYWTGQSMDQSNRKLCNKVVECINGDTQTTIFDEIGRCQTEYDQSERQ